MAKTKERVPYADECSDETPDNTEALIKEAMGEGEKTEDVSNDMNDAEVSFHNTISCIMSQVIVLLFLLLFDIFNTQVSSHLLLFVCNRKLN